MEIITFSKDDCFKAALLYAERMREYCNSFESVMKAPSSSLKFNQTIDYEDKVVGALLGLAIGDAMAYPYEGMTAEKIATCAVICTIN